MNSKIKENLFDSGLLAPRVGEVIDISNQNFEMLEEEITKTAKEKGFNLVYLSSSQKLDLKKFKYMGTLLSLEKDIFEFKKLLDKLPDKYPLDDFSVKNWSKIKGSIPNLGSSRFSKDPNISFDSYMEHKVKLIDHYWHNHRTIFKIYEKGEELDAFLFSYLREKDLNFYEGFITPRFRTGLLGASLLKQTILEGIKQNANTVKTNIYKNNERFLKTYEGFGLKQVGEKHFYHFWP